MSAATSYRLDDPDIISPSFITADEAALLKSARAGDPAAFECLVMPHWNGLLRITQRILRNREDAEDAVQTALLDAFRNLHGFHEWSRFSSWLTRIAMNAALMRVRVNRRKREISLDGVTEASEPRAIFQLVETRLNPEQEYLRKERRVLLHEGLKKLRPLYVEVLWLRGLQELSAKEAATRLEVPVGTVKARLRRARATLAANVKSIATRNRRASARERKSL